MNVGNLEQNKQNELAFLRCERLREIEVNQKLSRRLSFIINAQESELILKKLILDYACLATKELPPMKLHSIASQIGC